MRASLWFLFVFAALTLSQTATRSVVNPEIPSDTPTPTPISASTTPSASLTPSNTNTATASISLTATASISESSSGSISRSPSSSASRSRPPPAAPVSIAPNITLTPTPSPTRGPIIYDGPDSRGVEFDLFACGGSCSQNQIQIIRASIALFLGISEEAVEIQRRGDSLVIVVCTQNPDDLLNAISTSDPDLISNLLETSTIVSDPIYLDRCPIQFESSSDASTITAVLSLFGLVML